MTTAKAKVNEAKTQNALKLGPKPVKGKTIIKDLKDLGAVKKVVAQRAPTQEEVIAQAVNDYAKFIESFKTLEKTIKKCREVFKEQSEQGVKILRGNEFSVILDVTKDGGSNLSPDLVKAKIGEAGYQECLKPYDVLRTKVVANAHMDLAAE